MQGRCSTKNCFAHAGRCVGASQGKFRPGVYHLRDGVQLEDRLPFGDPPVWLQPVHHALGALLLEQGRIDKAEEVYKQDLGLSKQLPRRKARPNNVWSLHGLYERLIRSGKTEEVQMIRLQRDIAVASADIPLAASCFCRL